MSKLSERNLDYLESLGITYTQLPDMKTVVISGSCLKYDLFKGVVIDEINDTTKRMSIRKYVALVKGKRGSKYEQV